MNVELFYFCRVMDKNRIDEGIMMTNINIFYKSSLNLYPMGNLGVPSS